MPEDIKFVCPECKQSISFIQSAKVKNIFDGSGNLIDQQTIHESDKITCGYCGYKGNYSEFNTEAVCQKH